MIQSEVKSQKILITGGTSGLGLELVHLFLKEGYNVIATGRQTITLSEYGEQFTLYNIDFGDLRQVADKTKQMCRDHAFNLIINNAGVLSPPNYTESYDGIEYSFQVNFLAHLLINEIILSSVNDGRDIRIASVTSPLYRFASLKPEINSGSSGYSPVGSYSTSKLCVALMCEILTSRHGSVNLKCFSFDPGTFSSVIYRMQKKWFRQMYRIAAPFMRSPVKVAKVMKDLMLDNNTESCQIYDILKRHRSIPEIDRPLKEAFINSCYKLTDHFIR